MRWKALCLYFSKLIDFLKSTNGARRNDGFSEPSGEKYTECQAKFELSPNAVRDTAGTSPFKQMLTFVCH